MQNSLKDLLKLSAPVILMYLGLILMGFVDLLVVGRLNADAVGAVGLGSSLFSWAMCIGIGLITGMDFPVSHAFGAQKRNEAYINFVQGFHLSWMAGIPLTLLVIGVAFCLPLFGVSQNVLELTQRYILITAPSMLFVTSFNALKTYLQAQSIAVPTFIILVLGNLLNLWLDIGLVFGKLGLPQMGFDGAAFATLISRFFLVFALALVIYLRDLKTDQFFRSIGLPLHKKILMPILKLGTPASLQMALEVGVFSLATTLAAKFDSDRLAAHQIVLNAASMTFMVPLGLSSAAAALVGNAMGAQNKFLAKRLGNLALACGFIFMSISALTMLSFPQVILGFYTDQPNVITAAKTILLIAALFQISDGIQVVGTGILRGIGETKITAIANLIGHWIVGLPLAIYLGFYTDLKLQGLWIGLSTGLTIVAMVLGYEWRRRSRSLIL